MPLPTSGWSITRVIGRFTAAVRLLGCVDCLSRVRGDPYARFCGEGVVAILPPYPTSYGRSVGEVLLSDGRSLNQALVRDHLLKTNTDPEFQISVLEEGFANFHRYFFIMPLLAQFELEVHRRVERGQGVTAEDMNALMADLYAEGYGSEMQFDRDRTAITWATFGHLYQDYYVYQYSTGISGAHALSRRILAGVPNAAEDYLRALRVGNSMYPLDTLKLAGVDMSTPQPIEETFEILANMVDRLEELTKETAVAAK